MFLSAAVSFGAVVSGSGCSGGTTDGAPADGGRTETSSPTPTGTPTGTGTSTTSPTGTNTTPTPPGPPVDGGRDADADAEASAPGPCAGKRVLLLGEDFADTLAAMNLLLTEEGFTVRPIADYTTDDPADGGDAGTALSGYDVFVFLMGNNYQPMPEPLQRAVLAAHAAGTGIVFEEWSSYHVYSTALTSLLAPIMLFAYEDFDSAHKVTLTASAAAHPVWAGLPASFTTTVEMGTGYGTREAGTSEPQVIATLDVNDAGITGREAVLVRDGAGRIAQTTLAANYLNEHILTVDPNVKRLYLNMTKWVARCP